MTPRSAGKKIAAVAVSMLFAAAALAVYHAFAFSPFVPIRIDVVGEELSSSRRIITITLPDLSTLRGDTAVLAFQLRNGGPEPKLIGLLRDGLPGHRVVLPPDQTVRWNIVLSPELLQALDREGSDAARTLELTGDADGWSLTAFEIRNYHVRWGDRVSAAVLPTNVGGHRVLLSRSALFLLATALFTSAVLGLFFVAPAFVFGLPSRLRRSPATIARGWRRRKLTCERGAALLALGAVAIAQPIFEVVSNSPEFFPARSTLPATAVAAVLVICFGVPLVLLGIERAIRQVSRRAAATFHGMMLALLTAALLMPWFRRAGVLTLPWDVLISAFIGLAVALAYARLRIIRQFLTALVPAALVVPLLFFLDPGVKQNFLPSESAAGVQALERTPPIVLVVFDEFPSNSLLTADGHIDAGRYPNFAALARESYWFPNASTVAYGTADAVPAIVSGRYVPANEAVPTLRYYPVNLFTVLARHYNIFASMRFQQLCPPRACQQNAAMSADTVGSLVSDLALVWLHIVLPEQLTEELPPVVGDWMEFGRTREARAKGVRAGRAAVFAEFVAKIDDRPARLHFVHLVLPHMPFEYVPSGRRYRAPDHQNIRYRGNLLFESASAAYADTIHQRHLAQVGYADRLIGDLIRRLHEVGTYDNALVIITADHGASYREGRFRRQPRPQQHNLSDILQVPLLMKLPGQRRGEVVDRIVETVDIFPTILDVVGAKTSLRLDGRSLIDARAPARTSFFVRSSRVGRAPRRVGDLSADRAASLERKERRFGRGDLQALYAPPGARHLLGLRASGLAMRAAPDVQITISNPTQYEGVKRDSDLLPLYVRGGLNTLRPEPLSIAVVVNGIVAAIAESYHDRSGHIFGTLIPESTLRDGNNTVAAFVVDGLAVAEQ